jgi:hypothetical protein
VLRRSLFGVSNNILTKAYAVPVAGKVAVGGSNRGTADPLTKGNVPELNDLTGALEDQNFTG